MLILYVLWVYYVIGIAFARYVQIDLMNSYYSSEDKLDSREFVDEEDLGNFGFWFIFYLVNSSLWLPNLISFLYQILVLNFGTLVFFLIEFLKILVKNRIVKLIVFLTLFAIFIFVLLQNFQ